MDKNPITDSMEFIATVSTIVDGTQAVAELVEKVQQQAQGRPLDLVVVFMTSHFTYEARLIAQNLRSALQPGLLIGCTAEGVIGSEQEIEGGAAISLLAAHLPGVFLAPFVLPPNSWRMLLTDQEEFTRNIDPPAEIKAFLLLADPFVLPVHEVLEAFNEYYPAVPVIGGMASGALRPGGNVLMIDDKVTNQGAVGVALAGNLEVDLVVSQGCRPIWKPLVVNTVQHNVIYSLEGKPPLALIQDLVPELPESDRTLMQNGLFVGRAINPDQEFLGCGDFLVRGVVGVDRENGSITVGDTLADGEVIQFHLRDASAAEEDLEMMLITQVLRQPPCGALLFSCTGRGTRMYPHPNGDISIINQNLGDVRLAGFFCAGEFGPIGGRNFLHGHTASLALFRPGLRG